MPRMIIIDGWDVEQDMRVDIEGTSQGIYKAGYNEPFFGGP
jgi:hypothetical protein